MPFDFAQARENMIENDVRTNDVTDRRLISAMRAVPREKFVPVQTRELAYGGLPIAVGHGRYLLDPRSFAKLVQAGELAGSESVLDIGGATGYSAAVLARLANRVVAVEQDEALARAAETNLADLAATNVAIVRASLTAGAPDRGPYDVILLNGMIEQLPGSLTAQLREGGRLLAILAQTGRLGRAMLFVRSAGAVARRAIFDATVPRLPGFEHAKSFVF